MHHLLLQTSTLPGWLQAWVKVNPVTALADASRGLLPGARSRPGVALHRLEHRITAVFAPLTVRRYRHIG